MSMKELAKLIKPPKTPTEPAEKKRWPEIEGKLGTALPADYMEFITKYGTGLFAKFFVVYSPFASSSNSNLFARAKSLGEQYRSDHEDDSERFPYEVFPEPGGILPWGHDENGNFYFWITKGKPDQWIVATDESRGDGFADYKLTMTDYLTGVLQGKIHPLAGDYPNKESLTFEPALVLSNPALVSQQMFDAIGNKDIARVRKMLDAGVNPNEIFDPSGDPVICFAAQESTDILRLLIERGADVNLHSKHGSTALFGAASTGDLTRVRLLLQAGAKVDLGEFTPILGATQNELVEVVRELLAAGANPNIPRHGETPIYVALGYHNTQITKLLIDAKADLAVKNEEGQTPLACARMRNAPPEIIDLLQKAGASE